MQRSGRIYSVVRITIMYACREYLLLGNPVPGVLVTSVPQTPPLTRTSSSHETTTAVTIANLQPTLLLAALDPSPPPPPSPLSSTVARLPLSPTSLALLWTPTPCILDGRKRRASPSVLLSWTGTRPTSQRNGPRLRTAFSSLHNYPIYLQP